MPSRNKRGRKVNATGRSSTDRFVLLPHWMLRHDSWRTLTPNAKALLIDIWQRHNGANNGEIAYAVRDAEGIGLKKSVAARAFDELTGRGFLKMHRASTFTLKTKEARTWELTAEGIGEALPSKDFMRWSSGSQSPQRDCEARTKAQTSARGGHPENRTQSPQRDTQSLQRDCDRLNETKLPVSVPPAGPSEAQSMDSQSLQRDTYNIPSPVQDDGGCPLPASDTDLGQPAPALDHPLINQPASSSDSEAGAVPPSVQPEQPCEAIPPTGTSTTSVAAGRQRQRRQPEQSAGIIPDPRQVDLEDLLGGKSSSAPPADRLRADLSAHIVHAPKGETKRIAAMLGLSSYQISNFRAGRFGLNPTAASMLREYLREHAA